MKLPHFTRCLAALLLAPVAFSQGELWRFPGQVSANAGDADADGRTDFLVLAGPSPSGPATRAEVRSGANGSVLASYSVTLPLATLETPRGIGDVSGDGRSDVAVVEQRTTGSNVLVLSGATGQVLHALVAPATNRKFSSIEPIGDLDADGAADYAVGVTAVGAGTIGEAWLVSGATGSLIRTIVAPASVSAWGTALARFDDLDGDGLDDLAVGATDRATIVSTSTGAVLFNIRDTMPTFGSALARIDDVDGDGLSELAIGAPGTFYTPAMPPTCALYVYYVPSGTLLRKWVGSNTQRRLGHQVRSAGDFDGDGFGDVLYCGGFWYMGCCLQAPVPVEIVSVQTGTVLYIGWADDSASLDTVGDIDGDGKVDYITGAYFHYHGSPGVSVILTGRQSPDLVLECARFVANNTNSLGCAPVMGHWGAPSLSMGQPLELSAQLFRNRVSAAMIATFGSVPGVPFAQQALCLAGPRQYLRIGNTGGSATGNDCTGTLNVPLSQAQMAQLGWTAGSVLTVQCWARDPGFVAHGELSLSEALYFTIWP